MSTIRKEVQMYASACERLLSFEADPELTQDEQDLILYYAHEIVNEFDVARRIITTVPSPALARSADANRCDSGVTSNG